MHFLLMQKLFISAKSVQELLFMFLQGVSSFSMYVVFSICFAKRAISAMVPGVGELPENKV